MTTSSEMTAVVPVHVPVIDAVLGPAGELGPGDAAYLPSAGDPRLGPFAWRTVTDVRPGSPSPMVQIITAEGPTVTLRRSQLVSHVKAQHRSPIEAA